MNWGFAEWRELWERDPRTWSEEVSARLRTCRSHTGTSVLADAPVADREGCEGPLGGIPFAVKDLFDQAGSVTGCSAVLPPVRDRVAAADAACVERLCRLGAQPVARSQMNEFAYGLSGENPHFGDCPHPWLAGCLSGGSSSGSAHLVGAGILPLALGTDTGGSIRLPAAWCGLFGVRWAPGRWMEGCFPLAPRFDTVGWFTGRAADMAQSLRAWFGGESDPLLSRPRGRFLCPPGAVREVVSEAFSAFAERFEEAVVPDCEDFLAAAGGAVRAFNVLQSSEAFTVHREWLGTYGDGYDPAVRARIERGREWLAEDVDRAETVRAGLGRWFDAYFRDNDYLALPVAPEPALPLGERSATLREDILQLTTPASLCGLPALTVPFPLAGGRSGGIQFLFREVSAAVPLAILHQCFPS